MNRGERQDNMLKQKMSNWLKPEVYDQIQMVVDTFGIGTYNSIVLAHMIYRKRYFPEENMPTIMRKVIFKAADYYYDVVCSNEGQMPTVVNTEMQFLILDQKLSESEVIHEDLGRGYLVENVVNHYENQLRDQLDKIEKIAEEKKE